MDFATLKRRIETGAVTEVGALVTDLSLIFDNAMVYNGKGTDYYRMAQTLKNIVLAQQQMYTRWRQEHGGTLGAGRGASAGAGAGGSAALAPAPHDDEALAAAEPDVEMADAEPETPSGPVAGDAVGTQQPRRGGRRGARK